MTARWSCRNCSRYVPFDQGIGREAQPKCPECSCELVRESLLFRILGCLLKVAFLPARGILWIVNKAAHRESQAASHIRARIDARETLTDDEFVQRLGIASRDTRLALLVREMIAEGATLFSDQIYPTDNLDELRRLGGQRERPWDWEDLAQNFEEQLNAVGLEVSDLTASGKRSWGHVTRRGRARDVGEVVEKLSSLLEERTRHRNN